MKKFSYFLLEGGAGKTLFGIDPLGNRSQAEVMQFARNVGYKVEHGPKHIKIINPKTGQLVASLSHGANRNEWNEKYALRNIARDLETSGSGLRADMPAKVVADRLRSGTAQGRQFPVASIGSAALAGAGTMLGSALTQGTQAAMSSYGGMLTPPPPKERMQTEKTFNTDVGLGFDLSPEGELVANPEGLKAVRQRQRQGLVNPTMFPSELYKKEEIPSKEQRAANLLNAASFYNQYNPNWATDMYFASALNPRTDKGRMYGEKNFNSDIGLAFNLSDGGELIGDPEGFAAVGRRTREKRNFPTIVPQMKLENFDPYLDKPNQKWAATIKYKTKDGRDISEKIESDVNIRKAVHEFVGKLKKNGHDFIGVDYHD
jgi:hypothetical protein